jgi:hypothetical protein
MIPQPISLHAAARDETRRQAAVAETLRSFVRRTPKPEPKRADSTPKPGGENR